jgi:hypothetical protein
MKLAWLSVAAVLAAVAPAAADGDGYGSAAPPPTPATDSTTSHPPSATDPDSPAFRPKPMRKDIVITVDGDRTSQNIALVGGVAGAGALLSGLAVYFNLDSKTAAESVSPRHPANVPWTQTQVDQVDHAHSSAIKAGIFYGLGGATLIGAIVMYIVTEPKAETIVIHPHYGVQPIVAPTPSGAVIGGAWRF